MPGAGRGSQKADTLGLLFQKHSEEPARPGWRQQGQRRGQCCTSGKAKFRAPEEGLENTWVGNRRFGNHNSDSTTSRGVSLGVHRGRHQEVRGRRPSLLASAVSAPHARCQGCHHPDSPRAALPPWPGDTRSGGSWQDLPLPCSHEHRGLSSCLGAPAFFVLEKNKAFSGKTHAPG